MQSDRVIYTDVVFTTNQEKRARKLLRLTFWVVCGLQVAWTVGLSVKLGLSLMMAFQASMTVLFFSIVILEPRLRFRPFAHIVFIATFFDIWFIQLKLEGLAKAHAGSVYLWFLVLVVGSLLVFIRESRRVVASYVALAFASFVVCEFGMVQSEAALALHDDPQAEALATAITRISVFAVITLLTFAWVREVKDAEINLATANDRLEDLLENMLPKPISERLRREGKTFADGIAECSVMFSDLVGFTKLSSSMAAEDLVHLLDEIFSKFDQLTADAGLEKIKTIGDSYMVAAGLPDPRPDHALALVELAFQMQAVIREYGLHVRTGINSGSVVAGVIGRKKFIYDLWGDTVNVASRMESQGVIDEVQVTESTAKLLGDAFELTRRGEVEIKGKGKMLVYLVHRFGATS